MVPLGVPSSRLYLKQPTMSKRLVRTKSSSCSKSASVSPGWPTMKVVRSAMSGMRVRSLVSSSCVRSALVWRRMRESIWSLACCSGMSMYFTTFGRRAIASTMASVKVLGYAYMRRIQPPPCSRATPSSDSSRPTRPRGSPMSMPQLVVSCPITFSSKAPSSIKRPASVTISDMGFERILPRIDGMVQNAQR